MMSKNQEPKNIDFNALALKLASPERIREWSYGEVVKPETINYRTGRSERGGLFDERIFGPEKDYECYCGKYRRIRYKNIVCERCGVEVTNSIVRRERLGHIELAAPVAHIWFVRAVPSRLGLFLDLSVTDLERVIYFAGYIVTKINPEQKTRLLKELDQEFKQRLKNEKDGVRIEELKLAAAAARKNLEALKPGKVLDEVAYHQLSLKYGSAFEADTGAEALYTLCRETDLGVLSKKLQEDLENAGSAAERGRLQRRFNLVRSMKRVGLRPEWMFLTVIPVIPPDLRPMVALDGGRYATSDVNDLYRRVINRNNRLKKLKELDAPEVILRNEKRILQEAVDALIDNSMRRGSSAPLNQAQKRLALRSLSDNLKGKQGRFRQNLLGKRVDYSGRSVIVVGPQLKLHQCGLPKLMALELFRPFVMAKILERELAFNIRGAGRLIDEKTPEVWEILEEVIQDKYVLLNRAPTLHRLGIQAFQPVLIEGSAIEIHPLVCAAFNADFDGDQMAVHVPLSAVAQKEAREIMAANKNLLKPGSGNPIVNPRLDIILGCFWATCYVDGAKGEGRIFTSVQEALIAYEFGILDLRAKIQVLPGDMQKLAEFQGQLFETSAGRILFNEIFPFDFPFLNQAIHLKEMNVIVETLVNRYEPVRVSLILDAIKNFGFHYATVSGVTWGLDEIRVPVEKERVVSEAEKEITDLEEKYNSGLLSDGEKYRMAIRVWTSARNKIEQAVLANLSPYGSVSYLLSSGARGAVSQINQMGGMKGLIVNPAGRLIEMPVIPSYKDGLSPLEYFVTTHGSRKTLTDTALNTAKAGYLTRRLVYVAENVVVSEEDCGDNSGKTISMTQLTAFDRSLSRWVRGRVLAKAVKGKNGKTLFAKGHLLTKDDVKILEKEGIETLVLRTLLSCQSVSGVCRLCYGLDLGRGHLVDTGEAVGIVAAQAIGEPGTQLTMRTKHTGGVDVGGDIVGGLPRVEEIFERRTPQNPATLSTTDGLVSEIKSDNRGKQITIIPDKIATAGKETITFNIPSFREIIVAEGEKVKQGQFLTDGPADLQELFKLAGKDATEKYIISEVNKIYELQGEFISPKHLELIVRQMFSRSRIKEPGDSTFEQGQIVETRELIEVNEELVKTGSQPAVGETLLLGVSEVALYTQSFLSAASFAQATRVLVRVAIRGGLDKLRGLKENVIVGRLIPAGTGLKKEYAELAASAARTPFREESLPEPVVSE